MSTLTERDNYLARFFRLHLLRLQVSKSNTTDGYRSRCCIIEDQRRMSNSDVFRPENMVDALLNTCKCKSSGLFPLDIKTSNAYKTKIRTELILSNGLDPSGNSFPLDISIESRLDQLLRYRNYSPDAAHLCKSGE